MEDVQREARKEARRREIRLQEYASPFLAAPGVSSQLDTASGEYIFSHAGRDWSSVLSTAPLTAEKPSISVIVLRASPSGGGLSLGLSPPDCPLSSGSHPAGLDMYTVGCTPYLGTTWQGGAGEQQQAIREEGVWK